MQWNVDLIPKLIEAVEESECLWNLTRSSIADQLSVTKKDVVDKWNSLRNTYRTALKASMTVKSGQSGAEKKPAFPYFDAMSFLQPVMTIKSKDRTESLSLSLSSEHSLENAAYFCSADLESDDFSDVSMCSETESPIMKRRKQIPNNLQKQVLMKSVSDAMTAISMKKSDMWSEFGDYIASSLRKTDEEHPDMAMELQIIINKNLTSMQEKVLHHNIKANRLTEATEAIQSTQSSQLDELDQITGEEDLFTDYEVLEDYEDTNLDIYY